MMIDPYYLMKSVQKAQARRYIGLASYIIYIYDFLLTYAEVQRLIWPSKMGVVKVCYYFNHIVVPIGLTINTWQMSGLTGPLSDTFCKGWLTAVGYVGVISLVILLLWVHAIYGRPKKVLFGLLAFFIATYVTILFITTRRILDLIDQVKYYPSPLESCIVNQTGNPTRPTLPSTRVIPIDIAFDILIFCMTLFKSIEHARTVKSISNSPIFSTLYRDGLGYFVLVIILKLVNLLTWYVGKKPLLLFGIEFFWGVTTALISRILLNLRNASDHCRQGDLDHHDLTATPSSCSIHD